MNAVIGTAGHVDHGKSALVKALTGITTSRPAELARGMTLDLGFAHFTSDQGHQIGVVDVPGHERFIRNMVAGVWSLDLMLLVIAADEGWMPMTTDHLKVAHAMGVKRVIVVINKSDTVTADALAQVEEDALERCLAITDEILESICVSSLTGHNIDKLRRMILQHLPVHDQEPAANTGGHLYIDRVFTVNGIGTVVTGSLVNGAVGVGDRLTVYPSGQSVQIRSLQAYHQNLTQAEPVTRVAIGLKGVARKELARGCCLAAADAFCHSTDRLYIRLEEGADTSTRNREVEVALGTWHGLAQLVYLRGSRLALLKLHEPAPCFWGQAIAMIRHGGSTLVHSGHIVWLNDIDKSQRKPLRNLLEHLPEQLNPAVRLQLRLDLEGYAPLASVTDSDIQDSGKYHTLAEWLVSHSFLEHMAEHIVQTLNDNGLAMTTAELSTRLKLPSDLLDNILQRLKTDDKVRMSRMAWLAGGGASEDDLNRDGQQLLERIRSAGKEGFQADREKLPGAQKLLRDLVRLGFATALEGKIYYTTELYNQLVQDILAGYSVGDRFDIGQARERTGLSRKYMIPLLNKMETDRWVRRMDNERVVMKCPESNTLAA